MEIKLLKENIKFENYSILVVDCDPENRQLVSQHLSSMGFKVLLADNFDSAKDILKNDNVHLVISELRMPQDSGIQLVKWVRRVYDTSFKSYLPLPFLIMTGFTHLLQQEDLDNYHIDGVVIKPIEKEELINAVLVGLKLAKVETKNEEEEKDEVVIEEGATVPLDIKEREYCRVLLTDFTSKPTLEMDIFIQLSEKHFVQIAKKGDKLNQVQFDRYQKKGIQFLYIKRDDFKKIIDFNLKLTKAVAQSNQIDLQKKKRFMLKTGELIMEHTFVNGINPQTFEDAKEYICNTVNTLMEDDQAFDLLQMLNDHSDYLYAHSLGVSLYSVMIAQAMGWNSGSNLFKLSYGALMHDIGKKDFSPQLILKPKSDLTFKEKAHLDTHPVRGKELLERLRGLPSEVISIAHEHHETVLGDGYPRQLKKNRISPMARIVAVADEFCYVAIKNPDYPGATAQKAMQLLDQYKDKVLDHDVLTALRLVIRSQSKNSHTG